MTSGVSVSDSCISTFDAIKKEKKYRYVVFHVSNEEKIDIDNIGERDATYEDFLHDLKAGQGEECRYGVYDYEYQHQHQGTTDIIIKEKIFLILWCPDTATVPKKMLYASSYDALKEALVGVQKYIQANDDEEASQEAVEAILRATDRN